MAASRLSRGSLARLDGSSPSDRVYAPHKLKQRLYEQHGTPKFTIVPPAWNKSQKGEPIFEDLWKKAERAIRYAKRLAVVGFSFTPTDLHVEALFRLALVDSGLKTLVIANPSARDRERIREIFAKPLTWSKRSRGPALVDGVALGLEQRMVLGSDGGSD